MEAVTAAVAHVAELGSPIILREGTADSDTLRDFEAGYHVPPPVDGRVWTVLDLGASIGLTAAHYRILFPGAKVIAVEMDMENAAIAKLNVPPGVTVIGGWAAAAHEGLGWYTKDAEAFSVRENAYRLADGEPSEWAVPVRCRTLTQFAKMFGPAGVDFCKIDVEGTERELLTSDGDWPERIRRILVECHTEPYAKRDYTVDECIADLEARGYTAVPHETHWSAVWAVRECTGTR